MTDSHRRNEQPSARAALAAEMRCTKDQSGLSYGKLAEKTHYSRSSWERFLNGKQLPTAVAVQQFAAATGGDAEPLLELLERAVSEEGGRAAAPPAAPDEEARPGTGTAPAPAPAPAPGARPGAAPAPAPAGGTGPDPAPAAAPAPVAVRRRSTARSGALAKAALVVAGAVLGSLGTTLVTGAFAGSPATGPEARTAAATAPAAPTPTVAPRPPSCRADSCWRREPQAADCQWDATTIRQTFLRGMNIQLRYSAACAAVWGRIENGTVGDSVVIKDAGGREESAEIRMDRDTYTRMLAVTADAPYDKVTICGVIPRFQETECSPTASVLP
ncbi:helix-turn-helix domain-containing protein [Streptomyces sp. NPDC059650]|uniref:helix-turn-helix domain-containing protein n=1 Tax=Streptomyces sp. NPDC059650 TaxID=3346896 RepID=UPI0036C240C7